MPANGSMTAKDVGLSLNPSQVIAVSTAHTAQSPARQFKKAMDVARKKSDCGLSRNRRMSPPEVLIQRKDRLVVADFGCVGDLLDLVIQQ